MSCPTPPDFLRRKILVAGETTCGTYTDTGALVLNADGASHSWRGSGRQSRSGVVDGWTGERRGTPGSRGHAFALPVELTLTAEQALQPWGLLLLACGMEAQVDATAETVVFRRAKAQSFANYVAASWLADGTLPPSLVSLTDLWYAGNRHNARACSGNWQLQMTAGERIMWDFAMQGLIDPATGPVDDAPSAQAPWNALGVPGGDHPLVFGGVVEATAVFTDAGPGDVPVNLRTLSIDNRAQLADEPRPSEPYGLAPVFPRMPQGPSVAFSLAETAENRKDWIDRFIGLEQAIAIELTVGVPGLSLKIEMPSVQFEELASEEQDGGKGLNITGIACRTDSTEDDSIKMTLEYAGAASS